MKKLILSSIVLLIAFSSQAKSKEGKDVNCREYLNLYYSTASSGDYIGAFEDWKMVYDNCPDISKNNFIYGARIVKAKIKVAENKESKDSLIALLMDIYDTRSTYFPGKEIYVKGVKALAMLKYNHGTNQDKFDLFSEVLTNGGQEQSAALYNGLMLSSVRLYKEKVFTKADVFIHYNTVIEGIEVNNHLLNQEIAQLYPKRVEGTITLAEEKELSKQERELERYNKVELNTEKIFDRIATCDWLDKVYNEESFAKNQADTVWLKRASRLLAKRRLNKETGEVDNCSDNIVFFQIADALYEIKPTAEAARARGIMAFKKSEIKKAIVYFKEASQQEVDPKKRAVDYLNQAKAYYQLKDISKAKFAALKAASLKRNWGVPYVLLAQIYVLAEGKCGDDVFEKNAVYWAAIDKLNYAKSVDYNVDQKANQMIEEYKRRLPNMTASFHLKHYEGEEYTIGCGVDETVIAKFF